MPPPNPIMTLNPIKAKKLWLMLYPKRDIPKRTCALTTILFFDLCGQKKDRSEELTERL